MSITEAKLRFLIRLFRHALRSTENHQPEQVLIDAEIQSPPFTASMLAQGLAHERLITTHSDGTVSLTAAGYELCETLANTQPVELNLLQQLAKSPPTAVFSTPMSGQSDVETIEKLCELGVLESLGNRGYRRRHATPIYAAVIPLARDAISQPSDDRRTQS